MNRGWDNAPTSWQRSRIARNMSDAITYLISVAVGARLERVARTLEKARSELSAFESAMDDPDGDCGSREGGSGEVKEARNKKSANRSA